MKLLKKEISKIEDKVMRFMHKVSLLQDEQPRLAYRFLRQAMRLYHNRLGGYISEMDSEFNEIFLSFIEKYPSQINPKLL